MKANEKRDEVGKAKAYMSPDTIDCAEYKSCRNGQECSEKNRPSRITELQGDDTEYYYMDSSSPSHRS